MKSYTQSKNIRHMWRRKEVKTAHFSNVGHFSQWNLSKITAKKGGRLLSTNFSEWVWHMWFNFYSIKSNLTMQVLKLYWGNKFCCLLFVLLTLKHFRGGVYLKEDINLYILVELKFGSSMDLPLEDKVISTWCSLVFGVFKISRGETYKKLTKHNKK